MDRNQLKSQLSEIQEISVDDSKHKVQMFMNQNNNQSIRLNQNEQMKSMNGSLYSKQGSPLNIYPSSQSNRVNDNHNPIPLQKKYSEQMIDQQQNEKDQTDQVQQIDDQDYKKTMKIFGLFLLSTIFMNFDSGVVPVSMKQIHEDTNFNYTQIAMLGNFSYLGITFSCILAPYYFQKYNINHLLSISIIMNMFSCFLFCFVYNPVLIYVCRISMGFSQAFWVMYGPIWVNNLAPKKYQATLLGILGGFSPIGIMVGYIVTGVIVEFINKPYSWRISFAIQGVIEFILCIFVLLIPQQEIDIYYQQKQSNKYSQLQSESQPQQQNLSISGIQYQDIINVLRNPIYRSIMFHQTVLYFVAYTIQFWITTYLINIIVMEKYIAMILYSIIIVSAPLTGVIIGGYISDSLGGYKGRFMLSSIRLCLLLTIISTLLAITTVFSFDIYSLFIMIWFTVFFASVQIPITTGIILSSTYFHQQGIAQGVSQFFNNLLAYFFAPIFGGLIMDSFQNKQRGMIIGFRISSFMIIFSLMFITYAIYQFKHYKTLHSQIFNLEQ